ncbi:hypothetical protein BH10PSE17_BH10PSE17_32290 [soil metagenome]
MTRVRLALLAALLCWTTSASAQDSQYVVFPWSKQSMIKGPACLDYPEPWEGSWVACSQAVHDGWLADVRRWRSERLMRIGFDGKRYDDPRLAWTRSAFIQPQAMVEDRYLYDPVAGRYTVDRYLADLDSRFGGIDAVLIWPTYPNIGIDDRNQLDMLMSMPGGVQGVKAMVDDFHRRGVRVLFPFMLWDLGTRDPGRPWPAVLTEAMAQIGADGMNGDTQDGVPLAFSLAADALGHPMAFQPEGPPHDEALAWNLMSWGQYEFGFAPKVDRYKWLETRHMVNISDRWARSKTNDLQYAFFNGVGWESWENIWGIWNGITPRDAEATRRVATIERGVNEFLVSPEWEPFYPTRQFGLFASRWPKGDATVWTVVNRNEYALDEARLAVPVGTHRRWFDLYHGVELHPERDGEQSLVTFPIEARGFGAILSVPGAPDAAITALLARMKTMTAKPLAAWSDTWHALPQSMVAIKPTASRATAPAGMVEIPAADYRFKVHGLEVEGTNQEGVDVAYPWEASARRFHEHVIPIKRFFIDRTPVTNQQFKAFLDATRYAPKDAENFLKDWVAGSYPAGWQDRPVTWVSLDDARAYAGWAGKRLPHEWEWQYSAQGSDGRAYPWGETWIAENVATPTTGRSHGEP